MSDRIQVEGIAVLAFKALRHIVRIDVDMHRPSRAARAFTHHVQPPARRRVVGAGANGHDAQRAPLGEARGFGRALFGCFLASRKASDSRSMKRSASRVGG